MINSREGVIQSSLGCFGGVSLCFALLEFLKLFGRVVFHNPWQLDLKPLFKNIEFIFLLSVDTNPKHHHTRWMFGEKLFVSFHFKIHFDHFTDGCFGYSRFLEPLSGMDCGKSFHFWNRWVGIRNVRGLTLFIFLWK